MQKQFSFRFYSTDKLKKTVPDLIDVLENIKKVSPKSKRERTIDTDYRVRLEQLHNESSNVVVGELLRCQSTNLPAALNSAGVREQLDTPRLGHSVVFRYDAQKGVLGIQYDVRVISPGRFLDYLLEYDSSAAYSALPVLKDGSWKKFQNGDIRKIVIGVAQPADVSVVSGASNAATSGFKKMGAAYGAPSMVVELSMGHHKGALLKSVKEVATDLLNMVGSGAYVTKLTAVTEINDAREEVDLLKDRLVARDTLAIDDRDPNTNYQVKIAFLTKEMKRLVP